MSTDFDQQTPPEPMPVQGGEIPPGVPPGFVAGPQQGVSDETSIRPPENVEVPANTTDEEVEYTPGAEADSVMGGETQQEAPKEDTTRVLIPRKDAAEIVLGPPDMQRTYVQRPLSFVGRIEWFALVGEVLDKSMSGDNALTMAGLLEAPKGARQGQFSMDSLKQADTFVHAIGKLIRYSKTFLTDSYAIWLGVPDYERDVFATLIALPEDEGGLSDDVGFAIIERFIDQNFEALDRFFRERLADLGRRVQDQQEALRSRRSTPSSTTQRTTPRR